MLRLNHLLHIPLQFLICSLLWPVHFHYPSHIPCPSPCLSTFLLAVSYQSHHGIVLPGTGTLLLHDQSVSKSFYFSLPLLPSPMPFTCWIILTRFHLLLLLLSFFFLLFLSTLPALLSTPIPYPISLIPTPPQHDTRGLRWVRERWRGCQDELRGLQANFPVTWRNCTTASQVSGEANTLSASVSLSHILIYTLPLWECLMEVQRRCRWWQVWSVVNFPSLSLRTNAFAVQIICTHLKIYVKHRVYIAYMYSVYVVLLQMKKEVQEEVWLSIQADRSRQHINSSKMFKTNGKDWQNMQMVGRKLSKKIDRQIDWQIDEQAEIVGGKKKTRKREKQPTSQPDSQTDGPFPPQSSGVGYLPWVVVTVQAGVAVPSLT